MIPELIELSRLTVRRITVGPMDNNVYLLTHRTGGDQVLIDAAAEPDAIEALLASASPDCAAPNLRMLVTTHCHHDHIGALAAVVAAHPNVETLAGDADAGVIAAATGVPIQRRLGHGDVVQLADAHLNVIGLRGHTPGSVALAYAEPGRPVHLFTGDSLFPGGVGNTGKDPARFSSLMRDVVERVFAGYDDDVVVHPGHGRSTTLGVERPHLDEWHARGW